MTGTPVGLSGEPIPVLKPLGYQQIVGLAAATALTVPAGATYAVVVAEGQAVRYRADGTNPTAAIGQPIAVGVSTVFRMTNADLVALKFIQQSATATLNIDYYVDA
ncbi:MAG: hypothetical protein GC190_21965 [Alphaproteobacteria bacterium]|nr:hypothetical protein [Alphaproteobacteria bacterium]